MAIERLSFSSKSKYSAIELAIHLARYSVAQNLCKDLKILDVACGEGYGTYALASFWGAKFVTGVDISEEAVNLARKQFSQPNSEYISAPAENIDELFEENSFDMVISLETIEHVIDPLKFISAIKKVVKPDGIIILSCPNDHWYYGPGESQNPFHLRTYYLHEFKEQTENILGRAKGFLFGRPINGFGNFLLKNHSDSEQTMTAELNAAKVIKANQINNDQPISVEDCSYFIGIWGDLPMEIADMASSTFYPISMDKFSITLEDANISLTSQINSLKPQLESTKTLNKDLQQQLKTSQNRIIELEKWTVELQLEIRNSQKYVVELETAFQNSKTSISELEELGNSLQFNLEQLNEQIQISNLANQTFQEVNENLLKENEATKNIVANMQASKFWKLRNQWVKLKKGFPKS